MFKILPKILNTSEREKSSYNFYLFSESLVTAEDCYPTPPPITSTLEIIQCDETFCSDKADGLYEDSTDDQKYFHCANSITHCKKCQDGLRYDDSCKACNHQETPLI